MQLHPSEESCGGGQSSPRVGMSTRLWVLPCCEICLCESFTQPASQALFCQRLSLRIFSVMQKQLLCLSEACCASHSVGQLAHRTEAMSCFFHLISVKRRKEKTSEGVTLGLKVLVMTLGLNAGFGFQMAKFLSSLIMRQDRESESERKSHSLFWWSWGKDRCFPQCK